MRRGLFFQPVVEVLLVVVLVPVGQMELLFGWPVLLLALPLVLQLVLRGLVLVLWLQAVRL